MNKIINTFLQTPELYQTEIQQYDYIINGVFPTIKTGDYNVKLKYTLPGNIPGTETIFKFNNPF